MKKFMSAVCLVFVIVFGGCTLNLPDISTTSDYEYEYRTTQAAESEQTSGDLQQGEESTDESVTEETMYFSETTTEPATEAPSEQPATQSATQSATNAEVSTESVSVPPEMNLSISMPDKNGTMVTDKSADNKFIRIISDTRGIDASLLVAVYAVPESGQNYVFEFADAALRTAQALKKVYLIDEKGNVTGVASADNSAKENLSVVENWFCMNVLIKGVIFPAIEKDIK